MPLCLAIAAGVPSARNVVSRGVRQQRAATKVGLGGTGVAQAGFVLSWSPGDGAPPVSIPQVVCQAAPATQAAPSTTTSKDIAASMDSGELNKASRTGVVPLLGHRSWAWDQLIGSGVIGRSSSDGAQGREQGGQRGPCKLESHGLSAAGPEQTQAAADACACPPPPSRTRRPC